MEENEIIDFIIDNPSKLAIMKYYSKLKKESVTYERLRVYYDFICCLERIFFYDNSPESPICTHEDEDGEIYIVLGNKSKYQIYISPKEDKDLSIRIYRSKGHKIKSTIRFNYDEFDKVTKYDRYIIDIIFKLIKKEILNLFKKYTFY